MATFPTIILVVLCTAVLLIVSGLIFLGNKNSIDSPQKLLLMQWGILLGVFILNCVLKAFGLE